MERCKEGNSALITDRRNRKIFPDELDPALPAMKTWGLSDAWQKRSATPRRKTWTLTSQAEAAWLKPATTKADERQTRHAGQKRGLNRRARRDSPCEGAPHGAVLSVCQRQLPPGKGRRATGTAVGRVCFNTAMTGYQEILTDPSYAGQIIAFTFPHIGRTAPHRRHLEGDPSYGIGARPRSSALPSPESSNYRATLDLSEWLKASRHRRDLRHRHAPA